MFQLRPAYTPPIFVRPLRARVRVGAAGSEYEAVSESPAPFGIFPFTALSTGVGAVTVTDAEGKSRDALSPGEKAVGLLYIAPFVAGPPVIGYLLFGTIGAVAGAVIAAPAMYIIIAALMGT